MNPTPVTQLKNAEQSLVTAVHGTATLVESIGTGDLASALDRLRQAVADARARLASAAADLVGMVSELAGETEAIAGGILADLANATAEPLTSPSLAPLVEQTPTPSITATPEPETTQRPADETVPAGEPRGTSSEESGESWSYVAGDVEHAQAELEPVAVGLPVPDRNGHTSSPKPSSRKRTRCNR